MCLCHSSFIVWTNGGATKKEVHIRNVLEDETNGGDVVC